MDISTAMHISESDGFRINPDDEAKAMNALFYGRTHAFATRDKIDGYTGWQLHYAARNIIDRQDHSFVMEALATGVDHVLSGKQHNDVASSPFLRGVAYWHKLNTKERLKFCEHVTDHTLKVMHSFIPLGTRMHCDVRKFSAPLTYTYNRQTGQNEKNRRDVLSSQNDDYDYHMLINTDPDSSFGSAVQTVGNIYREALKLWQYQMAREIVMYNPNVPDHLRPIKTDAERMLSLQFVDKRAMEAVYGRDIFIDDRFANRHADSMTASLQELLNTHKQTIEPLVMKRGLARILSL